MSRPRSTLRWRRVDGILLLDKPAGLSSNQALQRVRRLFLADKGGHTGSLDPLATGLLPLCFGEATKIAGLLLGGDKAYETVARLGETTDTADADGEVLERHAVPSLDAERIERELGAFRGRIRQRPPVYSALKQGGEPLYRKARRGEVVEVPEREVEIQALELLELGPDSLRLRVTCSSGTYIRSLVRDLGERLGCGAHVSVLRRIWAEPFDSPAMWTLEALEAMAEQGGPEALGPCLIPIEAGLARLPRVELPESEALAFEQGQTLRTAREDADPVVVFSGKRAIGLARVHEGRLKPSRGFRH